MLLWNQRNMLQPPTITYKAKTQDLDLNKLKNALQEGVNHFKGNKFLMNELSLLKRIIYRMKMKFRSSKDFKLLEKLQHCLDIYYQTNLSAQLKNLLHMVPSSYHGNTYLPSKTMLQCVLVRLQGLVKLMERSYNTCLIVASDLSSRLHIGHFWKLFLILFALISRITVLVKFNTKFLCELYGKLFPHLHKLEIVGSSWLPENYILPNDLRSWLGVEWVYEEQFVDLTFEPSNDIVDFFNLADEDEDDVLFCDEYILLDDEEKEIVNDFNKLSPVKEALSRNRMRGFSVNEDDIGEDIADLIDASNSIPNEELENIDEGVELQLNLQLNKPTNLEDVGEEIIYSLEDNTNVVSLSDSPRDSIITVDDTVLCENTGKKKKKKSKFKSSVKKQSTTADNQSSEVNSTKSKRKLDFTDGFSPSKKIKKNGKPLSEKKIKMGKRPHTSLIQLDLPEAQKVDVSTVSLLTADKSVICLDDDDSSHAPLDSTKQSSKKSKKKVKTNSPKKSPGDVQHNSLFLSLDVTTGKENATLNYSDLQNSNSLSGLRKKGRYWQVESESTSRKSIGKNHKNKRKGHRKQKIKK